MGLYDLLTTQGSTLTAYNGTTPPVNPLATQQSKLHADGNTPGYSLDGTNAVLVNGQYNAYLDGVGNQIPLPSLLDTNGTVPPSTAGGQALPYLANLPQ
jgi:hypothetical protein